MNIYRLTFAATCPNDGELILYKLEIKTESVIYVEHLKAETALIKTGIQEQIADRLQQRFGGDQMMVAIHQGVEIETLRGIGKYQSEIEPMQGSCYCDLVRTTCAYCQMNGSDK